MRKADGGVNTMSSTNPAGPGQSDSPDVDLAGLRRVSDEIVSRMHTLRELLEARAAALEECRVALESYHGELAGQSQQIEQQQKELSDQFESRETQLASREAACA